MFSTKIFFTKTQVFLSFLPPAMSIRNFFFVMQYYKTLYTAEEALGENMQKSYCLKGLLSSTKILTFMYEFKDFWNVEH